MSSTHQKVLDLFEDYNADKAMELSAAMAAQHFTDRIEYGQHSDRCEHNRYAESILRALQFGYENDLLQAIVQGLNTYVGFVWGEFKAVNYRYRISPNGKFINVLAERHVKLADKIVIFMYEESKEPQLLCRNYEMEITFSHSYLGPKKYLKQEAIRTMPLIVIP